MSHEMETMMYAGATPWHRLGTPVDGLQTAKDAIVKSGLDWLVEPTPVYITHGHIFTEAPEFKAIKRVSDGKVLSIVGNEYVPIQNSDSFKFFDKIVGEGKAVYETAGSLRGGRRIWVLANLNGTVGVGRSDEERIKKYVLLINSHDQSLAFQVFFTPVRVVCNNTLSMALCGDANNRFYARHTAGLMNKVYDAQEMLGLANTFYDDLQADSERLARIALPTAQIPLLLKAAFDIKPAVAGETDDTIADREDLSTYKKNRVNECEKVLWTGIGQTTETKGSLWWGYNGVVEYVDHFRNYRGKNSEESRVNGAMFGLGNQIKQRAYAYVSAYARDNG